MGGLARYLNLTGGRSIFENVVRESAHSIESVAQIFRENIIKQSDTNSTDVQFKIPSYMGQKCEIIGNYLKIHGLVNTMNIQQETSFSGYAFRHLKVTLKINSISTFSSPVNPIRIIPPPPCPPKVISQWGNSGSQAIVSAFEDEKYTDVTIKCKDGTVKAHQLILCVHSPVLARMLTSGFKEAKEQTIDFAKFDRSTVLAFLRFFYDGQDPFQKNNFLCDPLKLAKIAHMYNVTPLFQYCINNVVSKYIASNDVEEIKKLAEKYHGNTYLQAVVEYYQSLEQGKSVSVVVDYNTGFGNALGICTAPDWVTEHFKWTQEGWKGTIYLGKEFKFVLLKKKGDMEWEKGDNRLISTEDKAQILIASRPIKF